MDSVKVFTGAALRTSVPVNTLLAMGHGSVLLLPQVAQLAGPQRIPVGLNAPGGGAIGGSC
jgi:hypothetical protein